ncbi:hypothetical protein [Burkholderia latens]|uniref:hypothetical protein n=1 Tax=Burkholderia latens TaxID=488446 RepID=UPI00084229ED|nr:hypothetical protein [Burkholderia latens]AOK07945.1 hypothetical protein WK25_26235 [Burkholderia latens]QTO50529.1 hypothetical protein J8I86_23640 [Burkholderia latens]
MPSIRWLERDRHVVGHGDIQAQARQTLADIQNVRAALGAHVQDVRSLFQYRTDIDTFMQPATFAPRSSPSRVP